MKHWVITANASCAEIFEVQGKEIRTLHYFDYPEGRQKSGEILTERPGRSHDSMGYRRHAVGSQVDAHTHELQTFAHRIVTVLKKAKSENAFDRLTLIAPPQFLGELRRLLHDTPIRKCIHKEFNKDISQDLSQNDKIAFVRHCLEL